MLAKLIGVISGSKSVLTVPLFHSLAAAINLEGYPIKEIFGKIGNGGIDLVAFEHMVASWAMKPDETYFELGWKEGVGFYTDYGFNLDLQRKISFTGIEDLKNGFFFGLRFCAGIAFNVGYTEEPLTTMSLCPEAVVYANKFTNAMQLPEELSKTDSTEDKQLCIKFVN